MFKVVAAYETAYGTEIRRFRAWTLKGAIMKAARNVLYVNDETKGFVEWVHIWFKGRKISESIYVMYEDEED